MTTQTHSASGTHITATKDIWLVAEREIGLKLRSKPFLISTGILLLIALAGVLFSEFACMNPETTRVAAT